MRSNFLLLIPLAALLPLACSSVGDSTTASNGTGESTSSTASTSSNTGSGGASTGSNSTGSNSTGSNSTGTNSTGIGGASTGSNSTGSNSTGIGGASTGSNSTGSNSTGTNSTGSNSTGTNSTGTNSTGIGGASTGTASTGSDSTGIGGASTGTASTGTGSGACSGYVDVKAPNGAQQHFTSACDGAWGTNETTTALGYHLSGGVAPGLDELDLQGCTSANAGSAGTHFSAQSAAAPGTFTSGSINYVDNNGGVWVNTIDPYKVIITKLDMPGGVIEGSFSATVIGPMDTKLPISGTFHVCRVSDLNAP
jgi:hypothetical protein